MFLGERLGVSLEANLGPDRSVGDYASALHLLIGNRPHLVVLDDIWRAEDAVAFKLRGEATSWIGATRFLSLFAQGVTPVPVLSEEEGMALVTQIAPGVVDGYRARVFERVRRVEGLPLAIVLIGMYLARAVGGARQHDVEEAFHRIGQRVFRTRLKLPHGLGAGHPSLSRGPAESLCSVFMRSLCHLEPETWEGLCALTGLPPQPGGFTEELAQTRCSLGALDALCDWGLLSYLHGSDRYRLHPVLIDCVRLVLDGHVEEMACPVCKRSPFSAVSGPPERKEFDR